MKLYYPQIFFLKYETENQCFSMKIEKIRHEFWKKFSKPLKNPLELLQGAPWEVRRTVSANSTRKNKKKLYVKLVAILEEATGSWNIQIYKTS